MQAGLFPINAEVNGQLFTQVRYYGTDDLSELWGLIGGQPAIVATGPGLVKQARGMGHMFADGSRSKWVLELADGSEWLATPTGGCGCGHKLRHWNPAKAVRT